MAVGPAGSTAVKEMPGALVGNVLNSVLPEEYWDESSVPKPVMLVLLVLTEEPIAPRPGTVTDPVETTLAVKAT